MSNAIPSGWEIKTLDEVATVFAGGTPSRSNPAYYDGSVPWVKSGEVNKRLIYRTEEAISELAVKESSAKWAKRGSVLVAMYGATAGKVAKLMIDATLNQAVSAVNRKSETTDNDFLFYAIENNSRELLNTVQGSGQPNLSGQLIKSLNLHIPPFPEQQKIATILSSVDNVIEKTHAQIDKLKDLKTGMMQELLTKGIGHTEFKDSPVGQIPKAWGYERLENVATIQTGIAINSKIIGYLVDIPYLRVANVQDGYLDLTEVKTLQIERNRLERFMLRDEDVLVNEGGDFDKLGRGFIWKNQISPCVHQNHVFVVRTDQKKILPMYFNYLSGSQYGKKYYLGCAKQTTNLASINSSQLKLFPVLLPAVEEQERICKILNSIDLNIGNIEQKLFSIEMTKKALMQDLLTGKVRVKTQKDMLKNVE